MLASLISHSTCDEDGSTPLHLAAAHGALASIEALAGMGADLDMRDGQGCSPIAVASYCNHLEAVKLLLHRGADPKAKDNHSRSPIQYAAASRWEAASIVSVLIDGGADVNASDDGTATPIQILIEQKIPRACAQASPAKQFGEGSSDSDAAAHVRSCDKAIAALMENGADLQLALCRCIEELTGEEMCTDSRASVIKQVISNLVTLGGKPDLLPHLVRVTGGNANFESFVEHICFLGGDSQRDFDGMANTAYIEVAEAVVTERTSVMRGKEMLRCVRQYSGEGKGDCNVHSARYGGNTSLHHILQGSSAATLPEIGCVELAHGLITIAQSETNAPDARGIMPLQLAVIYGNHAMARLLLEFNAKPDASTGTRPPVEIAMEQDDIVMAALLAKYGARLPLEETYHVKVSTGMRQVLKEEERKRRGLKPTIMDAGETPLTRLIAAVKQDPGSPLKNDIRPPHMHLRQ